MFSPKKHGQSPVSSLTCILIVGIRANSPEVRALVYFSKDQGDWKSIAYASPATVCTRHLLHSNPHISIQQLQKAPSSLINQHTY